MDDKKSIFETLSIIDMGHKIKAVQGKKYLPWIDVETELAKHYPEVEEVIKLNPDGLPYFASALGIFVNVTVIIDGYPKQELYPVLDGANRALKMEPYSYTTKNGEKTVNAVTSFDINTAIKRAYVKCVARHGLGAYVFQDLPTAEVETVNSTQLQQIMDLINKRGVSTADICQAWNVHKPAQIHATNFDSFMLFIETF